MRQQRCRSVWGRGSLNAGVAGLVGLGHVHLLDVVGGVLGYPVASVVMVIFAVAESWRLVGGWWLRRRWQWWSWRWWWDRGMW